MLKVETPLKILQPKLLIEKAVFLFSFRPVSFNLFIFIKFIERQNAQNTYEFLNAAPK